MLNTQKHTWRNLVFALLFIGALLFSLLLLPLSFGGAGVAGASPDITPWLEGWTYGKTITIDADLIDGNLTDFPVMVKLTAANFTFANANADGYDIRFTDTSGNLLSYERLLHDSTGNTSWIYVKIPFVDSAVDTTFNMFYRTADAPDGSDAANVWDANYKAVWHMTDSTTSLITPDSNNGLTGTKSGAAAPAEATGEVYKAQDFDGTDDYITIQSTSFPAVATVRTISMWVNMDDLDSDYQEFLMYGTNDFYKGFLISTGAAAASARNKILVGIYGENFSAASTGTLTAGNWAYVCVRVTGSKAATLTVDITSNNVTTANALNTTLSLAYIGKGWNTNYPNGKIDEVRVSSVSRSDAWIKAEYYSDSNGLLTYGVEEEAPTVITTLAATSVTATTATLNGNITYLSGGGNATIRGFKYGLTEADTYDIHEDGNYGTGAFSLLASADLTSDTFYYARAYATNPGGTSYGAWMLFRTPKDLSSVDWGQSGNWTYRQKIEIHGSGSIAGTVTASGSTVTGVGTTFTDWLVGDDIYIAGTWYPITAIASATSLTVTGTPTAASATPYDMRHVDYPIRFDLMSNKSIIPVNQQMVMKGATEAASVVLDVGTAGAWDDYGVGCVQVVPKGDDTYYMIYNGWGDAPSQGEPMRIGMATSPNLTTGGTWTKTTSGIGGTSKVLAAPLGYESIVGYDIYKVGSTWYLIGGPFHDAMVFTNKDNTQQWLYSTTDFITFTEIGWWSDIYDMDWAGQHMVMTPNWSLLKDNDGIALQEGGYYYAVASGLTDDATTEYGIRLKRSTTLDNRVQTISGTADTDSDMIQDNDYFAFTFTTPGSGYDITALRLGLLKSGVPTANVIYEIYAVDANHKPTGAILCSGYFDDSSLLSTSPQTASLRLQTQDSDRTLVASTEYSCVVKFASGTADNHIHVRYDADGNSGYVWKTTDGSTWTQVSGASVPCVIHKHIWDDLGWVQDPSDYNTTNTYIDKYIFDNKLLKWGDQYVIVHGGGYAADTESQRRAYFSYSNDISNIDSWVMCKEPWRTSTYKFEGRSAFYDDGTTLHVWTDWRIAAAISNVRVVYFSNNINSIISLGGHALTTFADMRWMDDDSSADLKHFMEESVQDSVNGWASQWAKIPYIPSSGQSAFVWIYYGNAGAADTQDPANVFTLFDHFTSKDAGVWTFSGTVNQSGTEIEIVQSAGTDRATCNTTYAVGYAFRNRWKNVGTSDYMYAPYMAASAFRFMGTYTNPTFINTATTEDGVIATSIHSRNDNVWHVAEITRGGNAYSKFYLDYFLVKTLNSAATGAASYLLLNESSTAGKEIDIDWAIVRKVCTTEPLVWAASTVSETSDISNTPSSWSVGVVQPSQTYWANGVEPGWPLSTSDCWGNLTNNSSFAVDISASMTNMTGGTTWSIGSSPGTNVFTLKIGIAGLAGVGNFTTLSNTPVAWITSMAAGNMTRWTMVFYTPTNSPQFADGTPKSGNMTFAAEAS